MKFYEHIFSIRNKDSYRLLRLLGVKIRIKIRRKVVYSSLWCGNECNFSGNDLLKIAFYVGCPDGRSERYRVDNIIEALEKRNVIGDKYYNSNIDELKARTQYDLLVIFRSGDSDEDAYDDIMQTIENFKKSGKSVIYDVDDYLLQENRYREKTINNVRSIIKSCVAVTTTTEYLANLLRQVHDSVYVVRNTINYQQYFESKRLICNKKDDPGMVRIVYQSGTSTHDKDFMECSDALLKILEKYKNVEIHLVGPLNIRKEFERYQNRVIKVGYMNYMSLLRYVYRMDINIAPLQINVFNNSKSELKIFEAAMLKIPSVVSGTEPYSKTIQNGHNGFIANKTEEWVDCLSQLIDDSAFRKSMGENAYSEIVPSFFIDNEIRNVEKIYKSYIYDF